MSITQKALMESLTGIECHAEQIIRNHAVVKDPKE